MKPAEAEFLHNMGLTFTVLRDDYEYRRVSQINHSTKVFADIFHLAYNNRTFCGVSEEEYKLLPESSYEPKQGAWIGFWKEKPRCWNCRKCDRIIRNLLPWRPAYEQT